MDFCHPCDATFGSVGVQVGGTPAVMKLLLDHGHINGDCLTCTGMAPILLQVIMPYWTSPAMYADACHTGELVLAHAQAEPAGTTFCLSDMSPSDTYSAFWKPAPQGQI